MVHLRRTRDGKPFPMKVGIVVAASAAAIVLLAYMGPQPYGDQGRFLSVPISIETDAQLHPASSKNKIQPRDCGALLESFEKGTAEFEDHNKRQMFVRYTDTTPGFYLSLHTQSYDALRYDIMERGQYYESALTDAYREVLDASPANARVLDVGGNVGWFAFYAAALGHHVDVFEPNRNHNIRICESIKLNGFDPIEDWQVRTQKEKKGSVNLFPFGVNDKHETTLPLIVPYGKSSSGMGTFRDEQAFTRNKEMATVHDEIKLVSLDHFAEDHGIFESGDSIALMKVDVEGFEPNVIKGASKLLEKHLVENIFMEITYHDGDMAPEMDMLKSLLDAGYKLHRWGRWKGPNKDLDSGTTDTIDFLKKTCMVKVRDQCNLWWKPASA